MSDNSLDTASGKGIDLNDGHEEVQLQDLLLLHSRLHYIPGKKSAFKNPSFLVEVFEDDDMEERFQRYRMVASVKAIRAASPILVILAAIHVTEHLFGDLTKQSGQMLLIIGIALAILPFPLLWIFGDNFERNFGLIKALHFCFCITSPVLNIFRQTSMNLLVDIVGILAGNIFLADNAQQAAIPLVAFFFSIFLRMVSSIDFGESFNQVIGEMIPKRNVEESIMGVFILSPICCFIAFMGHRAQRESYLISLIQQCRKQAELKQAEFSKGAPGRDSSRLLTPKQDKMTEPTINAVST